MTLTRITIRQHEAFTTVANTLSFSAAGERLGLTASAISQLVGELEAITGFRVFAPEHAARRAVERRTKVIRDRTDRAAARPAR